MFLWDDDGTRSDDDDVILDNNNLSDKLYDSLKLLTVCLGLYSLMHKYMP